MDATQTGTAVDRRARTRAFVRHYLEMVAAMAVGMVVLHPVAMFLLPALGWSAALSRPDLHVLVMATTMAIGMGLWMRYRGHRRRSIVEMSAVMYLPFVVLLVPFWTGAISAATLSVAGHLLMLPAMLGVMLLRPEEYCAVGVDRPVHRGRARAPRDQEARGKSVE
jgi:flagellar biosynthetic protein FliP